MDDMLWTAFEFCLCALEATLAFYLFRVYLGFRSRWQKWHYVMVILVITLVMLRLTHEDTIWFRTGIGMFLYGAFCFLCFRSGIRMKVLCIVIYFLSISSADLFAISAAGFLFDVQNWNTMMLTGFERFVMALSAKIVLFLLTWMFVRFKKDHYRHLPKTYWIAYVMVFMLAFIGNFVLSQIGLLIRLPSTAAIYMMVAAAAVTAVEIAVYITFDQLCLHFQKLSEHQLIEHQSRIIQQYMQQKEVFDGHINSMWHDIKHHLTYIRSLAGENGDELAQYIDKVYEGFQQVPKIIATGDPFVDAIVNQKYALACEKHIEFVFQGYMEGSHQMQQPDLCVLLCNALDNAIEASTKEPDQTKRLIKMLLKKVDRNLLLHITNNVFEKPAARGGRLLSGKLEGIHGIGMLSMKNVVDKYNGSLHFDNEDHFFVLDVLIEIYEI